MPPLWYLARTKANILIIRIQLNIDNKWKHIQIKYHSYKSSTMKKEISQELFEAISYIMTRLFVHVKLYARTRRLFVMGVGYNVEKNKSTTAVLFLDCPPQSRFLCSVQYYPHVRSMVPNKSLLEKNPSPLRLSVGPGLYVYICMKPLYLPLIGRIFIWHQ